MANIPCFRSASAYQDNVLALPVTDIDAAADWYSKYFGMIEVERSSTPAPAVILERDGVKLGFAINGGDASQDGAAIRVTHLAELKAEFAARDLAISNERVDTWDKQNFRVFFVAAPDGLCYYFHEPIESSQSE